MLIAILVGVRSPFVRVNSLLLNLYDVIDIAEEDMDKMDSWIVG